MPDNIIVLDVRRHVALVKHYLAQLLLPLDRSSKSQKPFVTAGSGIINTINVSRLL
jgi:hypothetical protein